MSSSSTQVVSTAVSISAGDAPLSTRRPARRRLSTSTVHKANLRPSCQPLSPSIAALDLSYAAPLPVLAAIRIQVLTYLADLEERLTLLESPISAEAVKIKGELTVEEARVRARQTLEMLHNLRTEVCSHLPELHLESVPSVEQLKFHIPDLDDVRAHLPAMPEAVRSRLPDLAIQEVRSRIDDVRSRISDFEFNSPLEYIPTFSERLTSLQAHLSSVEISHVLSESVSMLSPSNTAFDLIDKVLASDFVAELSSDIREGEDMLEKAAAEVARAVRQSLNGECLIHYMDLPEQWRNNPFVTRGYRFIPLRQWPRLLRSLLQVHNETLNIHTHLIPFLLWSLDLIPVAPFWVDASPSTDLELPVYAFTIFSLLCLFTSSVWHTMAGCAHPSGMELCAKIDYVGIGWLISASIGTVVYYGFQCSPTTCNIFLGLCLAMGISGSVLPFMEWFNQPKYRMYRITFFVTLALSAMAPLATLAVFHSTLDMYEFIRPLLPSLFSYIVGLIFYATHFPECAVVRPESGPHWLDWLGGGSHAIWHVFVVLAISLHRSAMDEMKSGIVIEEFNGVCGDPLTIWW